MAGVSDEHVMQKVLGFLQEYATGDKVVPGNDMIGELLGVGAHRVSIAISALRVQRRVALYTLKGYPSSYRRFRVDGKFTPWPKKPAKVIAFKEYQSGPALDRLGNIEKGIKERPDRLLPEEARLISEAYMRGVVRHYAAGERAEGRGGMR